MNSKLHNIHSILKKENLDGLLISSPPTITYLTNYAGFSKTEREAFLLITKTKQYIITDSRYSDEVKEYIPDFILSEREVSLGQTLQNLFKKQQIISLGFEDEDISVKEHTLLNSFIRTLKPVDLELIRMIKTHKEIEKISKACEIGDKAFYYITSIIKKGVSENDIALELELFIRRNGDELSFPSIVAFGANSAVPHHHTGNTKLKEQDIVLLDFGVRYENYCSDMSRTLFFGSQTEEQQKVYQTVFDAQQKAIEYIQKSQSVINTSDIDAAARNYILSQGYPSIPHSVGHGIGIEVHESPTLSPKSDQTLQDGMVFSIEPGIYLSGKFGVRIEDLFTISDGQLIQLTKASSKLISL